MLNTVRSSSPMSIRVLFMLLKNFISLLNALYADILYVDLRTQL